MPYIPKTRNIEQILLDMLERIGHIADGAKPDPATRSAVYMTRLSVVEHFENAIGPDDLSPAAQKIRAQLRKM